MYFLDTNTCIYFLNGRYKSVRDRLMSLSPNEISIPAIVKAELLLGAYKSQKKKDNVKKVEQFLEPFEIIPFEDQMAYVYADIRNTMEKKGILIGPNDLFIASIVRFNDGILVTNNVEEFTRIKELHVVNWVE
jgi:tRNA(fMet)-specific endonuclease VapC